MLLKVCSLAMAILLFGIHVDAGWLHLTNNAFASSQAFVQPLLSNVLKGKETRYEKFKDDETIIVLSNDFISEDGYALKQKDITVRETKDASGRIICEGYYDGTMCVYLREYAYDARGYIAVVSEINCEAGTVDRYSYGFDENGTLLSVMIADSTGNRYRHVFDKNGIVVRVESFTYDDNGNSIIDNQYSDN